MTSALLAKLGVALVSGAVVASVTMTGLTYSQTKPPSSNPASKAILTYSD